MSEGNSFAFVTAGAGHNLAIRSTDAPPSVEVTTDASSLWPANQAMVPVTITARAIDDCTPPDQSLVVCQIASSQPDASNGSGQHLGDVAGQDGFSTPVTIELAHLGAGRYQATVPLRAEREGNDRNGRVYSIVVAAWDRSGNAASASRAVSVPHSQGKGPGRK